MENQRKTNKSLTEIKKELPYEVPENYFAKLNDSIRERIKESEGLEKTSPGILRNRQVVWMTAAAAVVAGLIIVLPGILGDTKDSALSRDEIAWVLEQEIYDLDGVQLEQSLSQSEPIQNTEAEAYEEEIIQYLLDENIELETIVNEL